MPGRRQGCLSLSADWRQATIGPGTVTMSGIIAAAAAATTDSETTQIDPGKRPALCRGRVTDTTRNRALPRCQSSIRRQDWQDRRRRLNSRDRLDRPRSRPGAPSVPGPRMPANQFVGACGAFHSPVVARAGDRKGLAWHAGPAGAPAFRLTVPRSPSSSGPLHADAYRIASLAWCPRSRSCPTATRCGRHARYW